MPHRIITDATELDAFTRWHPVPGYEGRYEVTRDGRVRSLPRFVNSPAAGGQRKIKGKELKLQLIKGYWGFLAVRPDGSKTSAYVHRFIAMLFVPNPDGKPHVNHIDGDKTNNDPANLEWVTHGENMRHAFATGLTPKPTSGPGEESPAAKLDWEKVARIREMLREGATQLSVAREFGITKGTVGFIARNETWRVG
jgi:hypothetical protein